MKGIFGPPTTPFDTASSRTVVAANNVCHPERSEGSGPLRNDDGTRLPRWQAHTWAEIPRCARDDSRLVLPLPINRPRGQLPSLDLGQTFEKPSDRPFDGRQPRDMRRHHHSRIAP